MVSRIIAIACATLACATSFSASAATFMCPQTLNCNSIANCVSGSSSSHQDNPFTAAKIVRATTFSAVECEYGSLSMVYSSNSWSNHHQNTVKPAKNGHWRPIAQWKYTCSKTHQCTGEKFLCLSKNPSDCAVRS